MNNAFYISQAEIDNSYGGLKYIHPYMIDVFDNARDRLNVPLDITSITRSLEKQKQLILRGLTKVDLSPHLVYIYTAEKIEVYDPKKKYDSSWDGAKLYSFAMDIGVPSIFKTGEAFGNFFRYEMGFKDLRIGYLAYQKAGKHFIHIDNAYILQENLKKQLSPATLRAWQPRVEW